MNSNSPSQSVAVLLQKAENEGTLSPAAANTIHIADIGEQIQMGIGVDVNDVQVSQVTLVTVVPDDSGSISVIRQDPRNYQSQVVGPQLICDGHNLVLSSLKETKKAQRDAILMHCRYLNGKVLYPFSPLDQALMMDLNNYDAHLGTPLYDQTVVVLGTVLVKNQSFEENGVPCRTVTLFVSDGRDEHSPRAHGGRGTTAHDCRVLITDLLKTENHIIAGMGIDDGETDFKEVFGEMGIQEKWILTPSKSPSEMRLAFNMFSQSAVRASQGGTSFSQAAAGGFGN